MKLKYYLRGLGIGIIVTTVLLMIAFALHKPVMSDADVINRAKQLGMIMPEDEEPLQSTENTETTEATEVSETTEENTETVQTETDTENPATTEEPAATETPDQTDTVTTDTEIAGTENTDNGTIEGATPYTLVVNRGDVCRVVCENLQANGIVDDAEAFRKFLAQKGFASSISVGSYTIPYGLDYEEIYQILKLGPQ
mgnify:FL=1